MSTFFSVVIPCFNRASSILPTLRSVQQQSFGDFECIVVDDGSDDFASLEEVISNLQDPRFRLVRRENGGGGAARNTGVESAVGEFIAFLDSDDEFLSDKLARFALSVDRTPNRAWYSQTLVDRGGAKRWARPDRSIREDEDMGEYIFVANQFIQTSTIVLSRQLALDVRFDPELRKGQDLDFCLRLHAAGVKFTMLEQPLSVWVDRTEVGRTSRTKGYEAPLRWLERSRPLLSPAAEHGYRATILAYFMSTERPLLALAYIIRGVRFGVPVRVALRQLLRCFIPRAVYRVAVNLFVAARGVPGKGVTVSR